MKNAKIYIETVQENLTYGRQTNVTNGVTDRLKELTDFDIDLIQPIKDKIDKISDLFSENLKTDELEVEFSFGITGEGNICIFSGSTSMGIKVRMKWKKSFKE